MFINNFNLLEISIWPVYCSYILLLLFISIILGFDYDYYYYMVLVAMFITILEWVLDIIYESIYIGRHTRVFRLSLYIGFLLYILSEVVIFISLFICYINSIMSPSIYSCNIYYDSMEVLGYSKIGISLLNVLILLCGGICITICTNEYRYIYIYMYMSISLILCILFSYIQYYEYYSSNIDISDSIYGTYFYCLSGLHGVHMLLGEAIILYTIYKLYDTTTILDKKISIYVSSINLHFLDICLLFIYLLVY